MVRSDHYKNEKKTVESRILVRMMSLHPQMQHKNARMCRKIEILLPPPKISMHTIEICENDTEYKNTQMKSDINDNVLNMKTKMLENIDNTKLAKCAHTFSVII